MILSPIFLAAHILSSPAIAIGVVGDVDVEQAGRHSRLERFDQIAEGALIKTGRGASAHLRFTSGSSIRLGPQTTLRLQELQHSSTAAKRKEGITLFAGRIWARVTSLFGDDSRFQIKTRNAVAGVRGTSFAVSVESEEQADFTLFEGALSLSAAGKVIELDRPGGFASYRGTTLSAQGVLDMPAQQQLMGSLGVVARLAASLPAGPLAPPVSSAPRGSSRDSIRRDLIGPTAAVDSPITESLPDAAGGATVELRLLLQLPEPQ